MSAGLAAKPLAGTRILDMSTVMLGPYATQMPGDYGADIVKIESPGGDSTRATHAVEVTYAASATCYFCATLGPVIGADFLGPQ